jgi:hypothetical protein
VLDGDSRVLFSPKGIVMDLSTLTDKEIRTLANVLKNKIKPVEKSISILQAELNERFNKEELEKMKQEVAPFLEISKAIFPLSNFISNGNKIFRGNKFWLHPETGKIWTPTIDSNQFDFTKNEWRERAIVWKRFVSPHKEEAIVEWRKYMAQSFSENPNTFFVIAEAYHRMCANGYFERDADTYHYCMKYAICWVNKKD